MKEMRLLDRAKDAGFTFQRIAPGEDGPLFGRRETSEYRDQIYMAGFGDACHATRVRKSSLLMPSGLPIIERVAGDAVTVLHRGDRLAYLTPTGRRLKRLPRHAPGGRSVPQLLPARL